ncbi:epoxyqueuosine reductase QueH [Fusobacterium sp. MFO224]|uniref:epoxyqueuosine reductase QueH n=1 Tax=Fusobacterium sp. MFO224 TaxID=3378070 RepID=UPI00385388D9
MKINYELEMQNQLKIIKNNDKKPSLLLQVCCAPCSSAVLEAIKDYFNITLFYYNPNTTEEDEYHKRLVELKKYIQERNYNIPIEEGRYNPREDFFNKVKGIENLKEGGKRCYECYTIRLEGTAKHAKENNYDYFASVLTISPLKNAQWINEIGENLEKKYFVNYFYNDFKKKGRYQESIKLSKEYDLYRQDYCGCIFSKVEMDNHRKEKLKKEGIHE